MNYLERVGKILIVLKGSFYSSVSGDALQQIHPVIRKPLGKFTFMTPPTRRICWRAWPGAQV